MRDRPDWLDQICTNCGMRQGKHSAGNYYSEFYDMFVPYNYCPDPDGRMHWIDGPGTVFEPTGNYKED